MEEALLLQTKLHPPPVRGGLVARPSLLHKLNTGLTSKLILISAPAGYGKTTLAAAWLAQLPEVDGAWLSLDEQDNDPVRFLAYFVAAGQVRVPNFGQNSLALMMSPQPPAQEAVLTSLVNEMARLERPLLFILDDYHTIDSQTVHQIITFLLEYAPPQLLLALTTRADPPLSLARLRARGQLTEVRTADLRFSRRETAEFLQQTMSLEISPEDSAVLGKQTEGWVAGLQMAALAMQAPAEEESPSDFVRSFSGDNRYVLDYLAEEVLARQPEATRRFMMDTSILSRLCGPLCDAVTGGENSADMLAELERVNLFIMPLDNKRHWYRYSHLFSDLLRLFLQRDQAEKIPELHGRAGKWYAEQGLPGEAVRHLLAAEEFDETTDLIEANGLILLQRGELQTLLSWLDALPEVVCRERPWLQIYYAWALLLSGQRDLVEKHLDQAGTLLAGGIDGSNNSRAQGHISAIRAYGAAFDQDVPQAIEQCRQALALLPEDEWTVRSVVAYTLGGISYLGGDLAGAMAAFTEASEMGRRGGNIHVALPALSALGSIQARQGDWEAAEESYRQVIHLGCGADGKSLPVAAGGYIGMAESKIGRGDLAGAKPYLETGLALSEEWANVDNLVSSYLAQVQFCLAGGDIEGAQTALARVHEIKAGHTLSPEMPQMIAAFEKQVRQAVEAGKGTGGLVEPLSERELEVLRLMGDGLSNRAIADELVVALGTVKSHSSSIYGKLGVNGRTQAVIRAKELGLF